MFSSLMGTSGSVRAYDSKVVNSLYGYPFGTSTLAGFSALTLAPNGLLYAVTVNRFSTNTGITPALQNTVVLVVDPGKTNGRNIYTGACESWSPAKAYLVGDQYTNRPQFVQAVPGATAATQYNTKGVLAPNGLLYFTQFHGASPSSPASIPGLFILNPGTGLITCTGALGTISGTTLTITGAPTSGSFGIGQTITGVGIPNNTTITYFGTGRGGVGTYVISNSVTIGSPIAITGSPFPDCTWDFNSDFVNVTQGGNKYNGGVLAEDNYIYLTPARMAGAGSVGPSATTRRIAPRSVAGGWTNPNNPSITTDITETGWYNGSTLSRNLSYFNTTPASSSRYFWPIDELGNSFIVAGGTARNIISLTATASTDLGAFSSAFYHPNGKIYYVGGGNLGGGSNTPQNLFIFYHTPNTGTWGTVTELVSKASLYLPSSIASQPYFLSAQFEKPLDTIQTVIETFEIIDSTTIQVTLSSDDLKAPKIFQNMLIESPDNIFNGNTYISSKVGNTLQIKNTEGTSPYNIVTPPAPGSIIIAKQDPKRLKVYLFRTHSFNSVPNTPSLGIFVFDPVTESVSLLSGTSNTGGSTNNAPSFPIVLPNGRMLRPVATSGYSNNIFTGTDSKLVVTPNRQNLATLPRNGVPGFYTMPSGSSVGLFTATSIPVAGNALGKTYVSAGTNGSNVGELVSIKGYGPGIRFFNVEEDQLNVYTIPKKEDGSFDADNFATSYYNYFFNRPC